MVIKFITNFLGAGFRCNANLSKHMKSATFYMTFKILYLRRQIRFRCGFLPGLGMNYGVHDPAFGFLIRLIVFREMEDF